MNKEIVVGAKVAFNDSPNAAWFEVVGRDGFILSVCDVEIAKSDNPAVTYADVSMVKQVVGGYDRQVDVWLVVTDAGSWGNGWNLREAFINAMTNASKSHPPSKLFIRHYTPNEATRALQSSPGVPMDKQAFRDLVVVDGLGGSTFPSGAEVAKLDIPLPNALDKAWARFAEAWDDFTMTETMDDAFSGIASEIE